MKTHALTEDKIEGSTKGSALLHLLTYMKPYLGWVILSLALVLGLTAIDLYRPMLIGEAIDNLEAQGDYDFLLRTAGKYAAVLMWHRPGFCKKQVKALCSRFVRNCTATCKA